MKKTISMLAIFVMIGALSIGCNQPDASTPEGGEGAKGTPTTQNWEPDTLKPGDNDGGDHTGHDHGPGEHQHEH